MKSILTRQENWPSNTSKRANEEDMTKKLFVGGIAWETNDQGLNKAFSEFGTVLDAKIITDRETGRSRGFGFVTFENAKDADYAIEEMDGSMLEGRKIRVTEATRKDSRRKQGRRKGAPPGRRQRDDN